MLTTKIWPILLLGSKSLTTLFKIFRSKKVFFLKVSTGRGLVMAKPYWLFSSSLNILQKTLRGWLCSSLSKRRLYITLSALFRSHFSIDQLDSDFSFTFFIGYTIHVSQIINYFVFWAKYSLLFVVNISVSNPTLVWTEELTLNNLSMSSLVSTSLGYVMTIFDFTHSIAPLRVLAKVKHLR